MDAKKRRPSDKDYDPTTIFVPPHEWNQFTGSMVQYWQIKEKNYDKIIFFKLGKFYEIFYNDAILCNRELDLAWMKLDKKLHVGFPEKMLDKYIQILVDMGHKIAVVE